MRQNVVCKVTGHPEREEGQWRQWQGGKGELRAFNMILRRRSRRTTDTEGAVTSLPSADIITPALYIKVCFS